MNQLLKIDQKVTGETSKLQYQVKRFIGGGTQGEVYEVDAAGTRFAVKWFFSTYRSDDPWLRGRLGTLVKTSAPSDRFVWPQELVSLESQEFGYVMPLMEPRFKSSALILNKMIEPTAWAIVTACYELAQSFWPLHSRGLCYRDISSGNLSIDADSGEIRIPDCDNVDGSGREGRISGTPTYMAPEIVTGKATPNSDTDNFSLAILLFNLLVMHHPFEGALEMAIPIMDEEAERRLYGTNPVFIFDPSDTSNRAVPGEHDLAISRWGMLPSFVKELFTRTFSDGIRDPSNGRVRDLQWRSAMARLRDSIISCPCNTLNFFEAGASCHACGELLKPVRIRFERTDTEVVMTPDTRLFPHHVDPSKQYDFTAPVAEVKQHPTKAETWGLKNVGDSEWGITRTDGRTEVVRPGQGFTIVAGLGVDFGNRRATFVA